MAEYKHAYWGRQIESLVHELSVLAIACDVDLAKPGAAERILKNDAGVCGHKNPEAFRRMRLHLTALFSVEADAVERVGVEDTREILDQVRAAITALRRAGSASNSLTDDIL